MYQYNMLHPLPRPLTNLAATVPHVYRIIVTGVDSSTSRIGTADV